MMNTARDRAEAHYRAAKKYMSYGDTRKSKAHMKRALHYGFGNDEQSLRGEIKSAIDSGLDGDGIMSLVVKTFQLIRESMITPDNDDSLKIQTINKLKDSFVQKSSALAKMDLLATVEVTTEPGPAKKLYVTNPTRFYALNNGELTNASIGPNLTDVNDSLGMSTAFCKLPDHTRRVHTAVHQELNRKWNIEAILSHLSSTALRVQRKLEKEAPQNEQNVDQHRMAQVLATFWKNAYKTYLLIKQGVKVEPLAHDSPTGLGVAVFQLMVVFEEYMLREVVTSVLGELTRTQEWSNDKRSNTKAWMGVLGLLLDGVRGAKVDRHGNVGNYYTLEWKPSVTDSDTDKEPVAKRTRSDFGRKYR